ncbi:hypothetical protein Mal52_22600 [Symmachiella dynata]|uniref:Uncharacterized protein n=1 Tax=Symmachiella dynata TaxID=2527995 RepID=A0A517ZMT4_9PLAN|nr:hypothetical protein Mal52_22600 [Symmachiella dynata]
MIRSCPQCEVTLSKVWWHGDSEMGYCKHCGVLSLATVCDVAQEEIAYETEFEATAVNDNSSDFLLRLSRLVSDYNVIQLKKMEITSNDRRIVPLGIRTNTVDLHRFMDRVNDLRLTIELRPVNED